MWPLADVADLSVLYWVASNWIIDVHLRYISWVYKSTYWCLIQIKSSSIKRDLICVNKLLMMCTIKMKIVVSLAISHHGIIMHRWQWSCAWYWIHTDGVQTQVVVFGSQTRECLRSAWRWRGAGLWWAQTWDAGGFCVFFFLLFLYWLWWFGGWNEILLLLYPAPFFHAKLIIKLSNILSKAINI